MIDADAVTETELATAVVTNIATALSNASTALSTATAAQTTANGRNKIFYTTAAPTATAVNDLWFDSDNGYSLSQWNGSAWVAFGLGNAAIANLDAGKITAGIISSIEIQGGAPVSGVYPFRVTTGGALTASSGTVAGFTMDNNTLSAADGNVRVEAFTNASPVYLDGTVGSAYEGGFAVKFDNGSTYRSTVQTYDGHYAWNGNGSPGNGYSALKAGVVTVSNDDRRMWMDFASSTGAGRINFTTSGSGSFPGLITSTLSTLTFDSSVIYTNNGFGVGTSSNQATAGANSYGTWLASDGLATMTRNTQILILNGTESGTGSQVLLRFRRNGADVGGTIAATSTTVAYNTTSDYRLKENVENVETGLQIVNNLRPVEFTWKNFPELGPTHGFIAHELQEFAPYAVIGEKDAVDENGEINLQQVDYSKITPILTAAIKELADKVTALESEIFSIKNQGK